MIFSAIHLIISADAVKMSLQQLLNETNTDNYFIEYMQFRSNHVAHGLIALHRLGATDSRLRDFVDWYKDRMEAPVHDEPSNDDIENLKGKRVSYYRLLQHFTNLLNDKYKNIDELIKAEFPKYILGIGCSAVHCLIHLGYGYSIRNERTVCEAVAYLHHSYLPLAHKKPLPSAHKFGGGSQGLLDLLNSLHKNKGFHDTMIADVKKEPWCSQTQGFFQRRVTYLITRHGDWLVTLLHDLKLDVPKTDSGEIDIKELGKLVADAAITVFAMADPANDFFLLHGVTGSWSMLQVLPLLNNTQALELIEVFFIVLMAVYVTQDCPELSVTLKEPGKVEPEQWDDVIKRTMAAEADEHIYKLVQVMYDMWKLNPRMGSRYLQASEIALTHPLHFIDYQFP